MKSYLLVCALILVLATVQADPLIPALGGLLGGSTTTTHKPKAKAHTSTHKAAAKHKTTIHKSHKSSNALSGPTITLLTAITQPSGAENSSTLGVSSGLSSVLLPSSSSIPPTSSLSLAASSVSTLPPSTPVVVITSTIPPAAPQTTGPLLAGGLAVSSGSVCEPHMWSFGMIMTAMALYLNQ